MLDQGDTVAVTGVVKSGFAQILHDGQVRWVNDEYLTDEKPVADAAAGGQPAGTGGAAGGGRVSSAPCADGSGTESGLTSSAVRLFRAVCNAFPALTTYGGYDGHGEHSSGRAIDFMISDPSLGPGRGRLGPRARLRARPLRHPLAAAHLDARCGPPRDGARCRTAARRRRTTSTTCTSRSTDLTSVTARS